jgi:hypothetical protein
VASSSSRRSAAERPARGGVEVVQVDAPCLHRLGRLGSGDIEAPVIRAAGGVKAVQGPQSVCDGIDDLALRFLRPGRVGWSAVGETHVQPAVARV